jgi:hypothetical protein
LHRAAGGPYPHRRRQLPLHHPAAARLIFYGVIKALISGIIVAFASETARRNAALGALVASLPLVSVLTTIWLWRDTNDMPRVADHVQSTLWYVLPSLPMFALMPWLWRHGVTFWPGLLVGCTITALLYIGTMALLARAGVSI